MIKIFKNLNSILDESIDITNQLLDEFKYDDSVELGSGDREQLPSTKFKVLEYEYEIKPELIKIDGGKKVMEISFYIMNSNGEPKRKNFTTDAQYNIALSHYRTSITNTGNSYTVLSKVFSYVIKYIKTYQPDYVTFDAREENRKKLYVKIMNNGMKYLPNYSICDKHPIDGSELPDETIFIQKNA